MNMNNEELIAKIADMAPGLIKEAEESGFEVVRKVDPEASKEIIKFLLKTPSTLKDILHDVTFAALRHLEAMGEVRPRLYVRENDVKLEWLAEDDGCGDSGPLVPYMEDPECDETLPDVWIRVLVNSLGCCAANRNDDFNDEIVDDGEEPGDN
jgi:hypothetical protein